MRLAALDQVADHGGLVAPHGERRSHSRQQRGMAEALAGLEHVDQLVLVQQLDRALATTYRWRAGSPSSTRMFSPRP